MLNYKDSDWNLLKTNITEKSKYTNDFGLLVKPLLNWNNENINHETIKPAILGLISLEDFTAISIHDYLSSYAIKSGIKFGELMKPMRELLFPEMKLSIPDALSFIGKDKLKDLLSKKNVFKL